jgi:hypothetical protein
MTFDYELPAELFTTKRKGGPRSRLGYRRFATAAEAIRFIVEEFPAVRTLDAWMQVGDTRYNSDDIRRLYESSDYPLRRRIRRNASPQQLPEQTDRALLSHLTRSASRLAAGANGFLIFSQSSTRPER